MDDPSGDTLILLVSVSLCLSILCSLLKGAFGSLSAATMAEWFTEEKAKKKLAKAMDFSIATNIVGALADAILVSSSILFFAQEGKVSTWAVWGGVCLVLVPLILIQSIAEPLARKQTKSLMRFGFPLMTFFYWLFFWVCWPISRLAHKFNNGINGEQHSSSEELEKEILHVVSTGEKEGLLEGIEKDMIEGIIDLRDVEAKEIMTPRTDVVCVSIESAIDEILDLSRQSGHSRIPVYQENRDDIVGIFYIKDFLHNWQSSQEKTFRLEDLMRKPYFIPETKRIGSLLKEFQEQKLHIAVVLDEYGGTAGIVTIEDIIEEIVGDIMDEYDAEHYQSIRFIDADNTEILARVRVEELNEALGVDLPIDNGYETVGGFLFSHLGRIPIEGDTYTHGNLKFTILNASDRRIHRIQVARIQNGSTAEISD